MGGVGPAPPPEPAGPRGGREGTIPYKPRLLGLSRPHPLSCTRGGEGSPGVSGTCGHNFWSSPTLFPSSFSHLLTGVRTSGLCPAGCERNHTLGATWILGRAALLPSTQDAQGSGTRAAAAAGRPVPGDSSALHRSREEQEAGSANRAASVPGGCQSKQAWLF